MMVWFWVLMQQRLTKRRKSRKPGIRTLGLHFLQKQMAFDDMSFLLLDELKSIADDPDISRLKDIYASDLERKKFSFLYRLMPVFVS